MSSAFVREGEDQDLSDIGPGISSLISFLTKENGGIRVYEKKRVSGPSGEDMHEMSNGLTYKLNAKGKWEVL